MKIAVTYDNGSVFQHFGHTEEFKVYTVEDGKVVSAQVVSSDGQGHGALAGLLSHNGIDALICGGIGMGAKNALESFGIKLYAGVSGDADEAVDALLAGTLLTMKRDISVPIIHMKGIPAVVTADFFHHSRCFMQRLSCIISICSALLSY